MDIPHLYSYNIPADNANLADLAQKKICVTSAKSVKSAGDKNARLREIITHPIYEKCQLFYFHTESIEFFVTTKDVNLTVLYYLLSLNICFCTNAINTGSF